jgi:hypothetical protein
MHTCGVVLVAEGNRLLGRFAQALRPLQVLVVHGAAEGDDGDRAEEDELDEKDAAR